MRQIADSGLHRQKTPNDLDGIQTLSDNTFAPMTVSMNLNNFVCLPLVSESQKIIWVPSHQIELQLDRTAELDKAFDRFPYLTDKQTAALAKRCSLHPDQVKVWFMAQRLRYGISWDYRDILEVWSKFKSSQGDPEGNEEFKNRMKGKIKENRGKKKKQEETEEQKGGQVEISKKRESVSADEQLERETKQEQPIKKEKNTKLEEDKTNSRNKRKRTAGIDEQGKKRIRQYNVDIIKGATKLEIKNEHEAGKCTQLKEALLVRNEKRAKERAISIQEWPADKNRIVPDVPLGAKNPVTETDNTFLVAGDPPTFTEQKDDGSHVPPSRTDYNLKTKPQLAKMKMAFLNCQYPDSQHYSQLAVTIGIQRSYLVEWFNDMRYHVKRSKPRWMNEEQHRLVLANIKYHQYLHMQSKTLPWSSDGDAT